MDDRIQPSFCSCRPHIKKEARISKVLLISCQAVFIAISGKGVSRPDGRRRDFFTAPSTPTSGQ